MYLGVTWEFVLLIKLKKKKEIIPKEHKGIILYSFLNFSDECK